MESAVILDRQARQIPDFQPLVGATQWAGTDAADDGGDYGYPERLEGGVPGWWILPSALIGVFIWVMIIRALLGWLL